MRKHNESNRSPAGGDRDFDAGYALKAEIGPENVPSGIYSPPSEPPQSQPSGDSPAPSTGD